MGDRAPLKRELTGLNKIQELGTEFYSIDSVSVFKCHFIKYHLLYGSTILFSVAPESFSLIQTFLEQKQILK